ncbi:hypothetical protein P8625_13070 [Tenacibaculum tangerinum]|uniref:DUF4595 domain-containing protein n=1 Tax=Tenacibaculum tangerinum TaxID=3038772 RepID=A0ABY8L0W5_9FLAO|nr:hypothetical protein [Tenacibaculum tangerinum]WGH74995.1 hypothetical protein P8625_13070 [Tenacibaculum tangerinum]
MKQLKYVFAIGLGITMLTACNNSASEDFEEINEGATKKRLKTIVVSNQQNQTATSQFTYDSEKKLVGISGTDGTDATLINYNNDGSTIKVAQTSNPSQSLSIEELYKAPYNVYETGEVVEYDSNKNPSKVSFEEVVYDWDTDSYITEVYTAEMFYDNKPNLYFSTLEAAGIIDVLDGVDISFGVNPQASEIIKARKLLPLNNLIKVIYKNTDNAIIGTLTIDYTYDEDGYPIKGSGLAIGGEESISINVAYTYE